MNGNQRIDILKIKEAAERAQACGMSVSEYTIRRAIRTGQLPCRIVGRTYLISWKILLIGSPAQTAATTPFKSHN